MFSSSQDRTIKIWSLDTNECIQTLIGHKLTVNCTTMLPNGNLLSFSDDRTYKIWDLTKGECIKTMKVDIFVLCLKLISNSRLATGSIDEIKIWSLDKMECIKTLKTNVPYENIDDRPFISGLVELPNGHLISSGYDKCIREWDLNEEKCLKSKVCHDNRINDIILLKNGYLASCSSDKTLKIWELGQLNCIKTLQGHTSSVLCLDETLNGQIVSGCHFGIIKVWDLTKKSRNCIKTIITHGRKGMKEIERIKYYEKDLVMCSGDDATIQIWNMITGACVQTLSGHEHHICHFLLA